MQAVVPNFPAFDSQPSGSDLDGNLDRELLVLAMRLVPGARSQLIIAPYEMQRRVQGEEETQVATKYFSDPTLERLVNMESMSINNFGADYVVHSEKKLANWLSDALEPQNNLLLHSPCAEQELAKLVELTSMTFSDDPQDYQKVTRIYPVYRYERGQKHYFLAIVENKFFQNLQGRWQSLPQLTIFDPHSALMSQFRSRSKSSKTVIMQALGIEPEVHATQVVNGQKNSFTNDSSSEQIKQFLILYLLRKQAMWLELERSLQAEDPVMRKQVLALTEKLAVLAYAGYYTDILSHAGRKFVPILEQYFAKLPQHNWPRRIKRALLIVISTLVGAVVGLILGTIVGAIIGAGFGAVAPVLGNLAGAMVGGSLLAFKAAIFGATVGAGYLITGASLSALLTTLWAKQRARVFGVTKWPSINSQTKQILERFFLRRTAEEQQMAEKLVDEENNFPSVPNSPVSR